MGSCVWKPNTIYLRSLKIMPITNTSYGTLEHSRNYTVEYLKEQKKNNPNYRVIDIGGNADSWSSVVTDSLVDLNALESERSMSFDICDESQWTKLLKLVKKQGKFDYCICTHTLEDLYNPYTALKYIPQIAKEGLITMPSLLTECSRVETQTHWRGYIHHRYIFDVNFVDKSMLVIPKMPCIEYILNEYPNAGIDFDKNFEEIRYHWKEDIAYTNFMDGYLGPTAMTVATAYHGLLQTNLFNIQRIQKQNAPSLPQYEYSFTRQTK